MTNESPGGAGVAPATPNADVLRQSLGLLQGPTDEHRFAGLLLATKHVQSGDAIAMAQLYNAMGVHFMRRLLRTRRDPADPAAENAEVRPNEAGASVYQRLAVQVVASFCAHPNLVPAVSELAPELAVVLRRVVDGAKATSGGANNVGSALCAPMAEGEGVETAAASHLWQTYAAKDAAQTLAVLLLHSDETRDRAIQGGAVGALLLWLRSPAAPAAAANATAATAPPDGDVDKSTDMVFAALQVAIDARFSSFGRAEAGLAAAGFSQDQSSRKFRFMRLLLAWVGHFDGGSGSNGGGDGGGGDGTAKSAEAGGELTPPKAATAEWVQEGPFAADVRAGLVQALHGTTAESFRDEAIALLALLLHAFGEAWAVEGGEAGAAETRRSPEDGDPVAAAGCGAAGGGAAAVRQEAEDAAAAAAAGAAATAQPQAQSAASRRGGSGASVGDASGGTGAFVKFALRVVTGEARLLLQEALALLMPGDGAVEPFRGQGRDPQLPPPEPRADAAAAPATAAANAASDAPQPETPAGVRKTRLARAQRLLPLCEGIVESSIRFLSDGDDDDFDGDGAAPNVGDAVDADVRWSRLPYGVLLDLMQVLEANARLCAEFLQEILPAVRPPPTASAASAAAAARTEAAHVLRAMGVECVRVLGVHLAADAVGLREHVLAAMPGIMAVAADDDAPSTVAAMPARTAEAAVATAAAEHVMDVDSEHEVESPGPTVARDGTRTVALVVSTGGSGYGGGGGGGSNDGGAVLPGAMTFLHLLPGLMTLVTTGSKDTRRASVAAMVDAGVHLSALKFLHIAARGVVAAADAAAKSFPLPAAVVASAAGLGASPAVTAAAANAAMNDVDRLREPLVWVCALLRELLILGERLPCAPPGCNEIIGGGSGGLGGGWANAAAAMRGASTEPFCVSDHPALCGIMPTLTALAGDAGVLWRSGGRPAWRLPLAHACWLAVELAALSPRM
ncbi:unnamed protein product, partial [Phaeothamnion confervicola]